MESKNKPTFAIIGLGYIAERHIKAIKAIGGKLVHVYDINNKAGFIDKHFLDTYFCNNEFEFFEREADYYVICSPNYLHFSHIKMVQRGQIICEKPLVLTTVELEGLPDVNCILQLRYAPIKLLNPVGANNITIRYVTPRGDWYHKSWKGDKSLSGGIATNIGIHLFDLMCYSFGKNYETKMGYETPDSMTGVSTFKNVRVQWLLSTSKDATPERSIRQGGETKNLIQNFTDLHTKSYEDIIAGNGWKAEDCAESIKIVQSLRRNYESDKENGSAEKIATEKSNSEESSNKEQFNQTYQGESQSSDQGGSSEESVGESKEDNSEEGS